MDDSFDAGARLAIGLPADDLSAVIVFGVGVNINGNGLVLGLQSVLPNDVGISPAHSMHILLVEDSALNQKLAKALLKKWGHHFDIANNGLEAFEWHAKEAYNLILMDLQMPNTGGYEATNIIRNREKNPLVKKSTIVAMTAKAEEGGKEQCIAHQRDDYLSKPFRINDLDEILKKYSFKN